MVHMTYMVRNVEMIQNNNIVINFIEYVHILCTVSVSVEVLCLQLTDLISVTGCQRVVGIRARAPLVRSRPMVGVWVSAVLAAVAGMQVN